MLALRFVLYPLGVAQAAEKAECPIQKTKPKAAASNYTVAAGTRIPLSFINSVSTKSAAEGDRVYLETVFPIVLDGRVVIPPGSYVAGTITQVKRPGRVKGRGELYLRFDSLTLPNGVTRDFRARVGALDGRATEDLDKNEGKITSEGNKGGDAQKVGEAARQAPVSARLRAVSPVTAEWARGLEPVQAQRPLWRAFFSRGPEAVLAKGTTLEMVIDRPFALR